MINYLVEIKNRTILLIFSSLLVIFVTYIYKRELLFLTVMQFTCHSLNYKDSNFFHIIFTDVKEIFFVYVSMLTVVSSQMMIIVLFYHIFIFFIPTLCSREYYNIKAIYCYVMVIISISAVLSVLIIIPLTWDFFLGFQEVTLKKPLNWFFEVKLYDFICFYTSSYYFFNVYFQMFIVPLCLYNLFFLDLIQVKRLRKLFYFSFLIFSAALSPPDIVIQILVSFFFLFFYEFFLLYNIFNLNLR